MLVVTLSAAKNREILHGADSAQRDNLACAEFI